MPYRIVQRENAADYVFNTIVAVLVSFIFYLVSIDKTTILGMDKNIVIYGIVVLLSIVFLWIGFIAAKNFIYISKINSRKFRSTVLAKVAELKNNESDEQITVDALGIFKPYISIHPIRDGVNNTIVRYEVLPVQLKSFWKPRMDFKIEILMKSKKIFSYVHSGI